MAEPRRGLAAASMVASIDRSTLIVDVTYSEKLFGQEVAHLCCSPTPVGDENEFEIRDQS